MDDCTLEKLVVKPGKLSPNFQKNETEYSITVASNVEKLSVDPLTSDSGASYCHRFEGGGGGKEVPLIEGAVVDVRIEVSAEDGTIKNYYIHAKRLSAKDATLSDLQLTGGKLVPSFSPDVTYYSSPDPKNVVTVCGEKPGMPTPLNVGETNIPVEVTSADGSNKQIYSIDVMRKQVPRYVKIVDASLAQKYECPYSLSPIYRPITIRGSDPKHTYSAPNLEEKTRTNKVDPLSGMPFGKGWKIIDYELDKQVASTVAKIPLTNGGFSSEGKIGVLAADIAKCNISPTAAVRKWEKNLHKIFDETDVTKLKGAGAEFVEKYFDSLPKPGQSRQWTEGESPLDHLENASFFYATAIKFKPKEAYLHMRLGQVLEERYYAEDLFGLKKEEEAEALPSFNIQAKESSKDEECAAICKLRGVDAGTAPIALQLKAIDEEYHTLVDSGQGGKADHVQGLYVWKSKQASQEGLAAQKAQDEESPLGQAYLKYMDALSLDEAKAIYNFHVGRLLVIQGNFDDAVKRLEVTLNWNPSHQLARYPLIFFFTAYIPPK
ncbi:hypothetical protein FSP39_024434 [Pinctada imbricata]|uniref:Cadherin-like beta-sandwich-like domain-containing protein n=1 Tax=Pinctada imbricata TaxID=66713 RepID=A0AA88YBR5_PINIB|nr:hypothetical protein FSP39_024434 [Pinctada imbricata]